MINMRDHDSYKCIILTFIILIIFTSSLIDKNTLFLFKKTESTTGIIKYEDLVEKLVWVEYEVDGVKYFEPIDSGVFEKEKDGEIKLLYDVDNPQKAIEQSIKNVKKTCMIVLVFCLISLIVFYTEYKGKRIYKDKKAKIVDGKIFEFVNNGMIYRVCLRVEGYDNVFYLDSDINLEPILEKLRIKTLPIYLINQYNYRVDSRAIEEKIEIIKERILFPVKKK